MERDFFLSLSLRPRSSPLQSSEPEGTSQGQGRYSLGHLWPEAVNT